MFLGIKIPLPFFSKVFTSFFRGLLPLSSTSEEHSWLTQLSSVEKFQWSILSSAEAVLILYRVSRHFLPSPLPNLNFPYPAWKRVEFPFPHVRITVSPWFVFGSLPSLELFFFVSPSFILLNHISRNLPPSPPPLLRVPKHWSPPSILPPGGGDLARRLPPYPFFKLQLEVFFPLPQNRFLFLYPRCFPFPPPLIFFIWVKNTFTSRTLRQVY